MAPFNLLSVRLWICLIVVAVSLFPTAEGGPVAYGICQSGCNTVAVACYTAGGATFGTVTAGLGVPAVIIGCNLALGTCMVACVAAGFAPTP